MKNHQLIDKMDKIRMDKKSGQIFHNMMSMGNMMNFFYDKFKLNLNLPNDLTEKTLQKSAFVKNYITSS